MARAGGSEKRSLRSLGNNGEGEAGIVSIVYSNPPPRGTRRDSCLSIGVGAGTLGIAEMGLFPPKECDLTIRAGDCSGEGSGRNKGRRGIFNAVGSRRALYCRASLGKEC